MIWLQLCLHLFSVWLGLLASLQIGSSRSQIINMYSHEQHSQDLAKDFLDVDEQPEPRLADAFACPRTAKKFCTAQQYKHVCSSGGSLSQRNLTGTTIPSGRIWHIWELAFQTLGHIFIWHSNNQAHQMLSAWCPHIVWPIRYNRTQWVSMSVKGLHIRNLEIN